MATMAYAHEEDGQKWLRITPEDGRAWDEPIAGWSLVLDLYRGTARWKHTDGRIYDDAA